MSVGVGPWPGTHPTAPHLDPDLLRDGDRRNVADRYRYWRLEAIVADLDRRRHGFHVAIENWQHDFNIGSIVRTANAFLAAEIHIVGRRRWNRRGAMVTDRYQHVRHHDIVADLVAWSVAQRLPLLGVDNLPGSVPIETYAMPRRCVLVLGQEGPGLSTGPRRMRIHPVHRPVRLDPVDQRRRRGGDRDAQLDPPACGSRTPPTVTRHHPPIRHLFRAIRQLLPRHPTTCHAVCTNSCRGRQSGCQETRSGRLEPSTQWRPPMTVLSIPADGLGEPGVEWHPWGVPELGRDLGEVE